MYAHHYLLQIRTSIISNLLSWYSLGSLVCSWPSELPHAAEVEKAPKPLPAVMETGERSPKRKFWF